MARRTRRLKSPRMEDRQLGDSDLRVSVISLGSWLTYSGGIGREQTEACTRAAFDAGITFFDTANVYGRGAAERAWGEILSSYPCDSYVLATKVFFPMGPTGRGSSRFPTCRRPGIGQVVCSPLAQGVLSGKCRRGEPPPRNARAAGSMGRF